MNRGSPANVGNLTGEDFSGDSNNWLFAGSVDIEHEDRVGIGKGCGKVLHQVSCARIAVRLENNVDAFESTLAGRSQGSANFCGMVSIVIDHAHARRLATELEPAIDTTKLF